MKEYQVVSNITEEQLNRYAMEGWETISVYPMSFKHCAINQYSIVQLGATLCREKQEPNKKDIRRRLMVEDKLKQIITDKFGMDRMLIKDDSTPYDMGLDSLDMVDYMMEIERTFNINIKDEDFYDETISFGKIVDCVMSKA